MLRRLVQQCSQMKTPLRVSVAQRSASSLVDLREGDYKSFDTQNPQYQQFNDKGPVWACNEWDPLEEVLIGRPENAVVPYARVEVKACIDPKKWHFFEKNGGKYWADVMPEHWKKLVSEVETFVKVVEGEGIKVVRADAFDHGKEFKTPFFASNGLYSAMPRDILMVVGDEIIEATLAWRQRYFEFYAFRNVVLDYWKRGAKWTMIPKPSCDSRLINENHSPDPKYGDFVTTETEPLVEAADFVRAGTDIFGQRSHVTNQAGIEWLRRHLAPRGIRVHELHFVEPRAMHIDTTFALVKPGYALTNPKRPLLEKDKFIKAGWKLVDAPIPSVPDGHPMWMASVWLAMNTLMKDPSHVFVEKNEVALHKVFEKMGVKSIPVDLLHMNTIGGGFHCWTCDIRRRGKMECYF